MIAMRMAAVFGLLLTLTGCRERAPGRQVTDTEIFTDAASQTWTARTFTCLETGANGQCDKKTCKQGPGGAEFDCGGWGKDCIDAGHKYEGTKEEGTCTRVTR